MKKKLLSGLCAAALIITALTGCGVKDGADAAAAADTAEDAGTAADASGEKMDAGAAGGEAGRKTLTVGFDAEFPPYGYMDDDGEYVGFDLEMAEEVCKRNGWELIKQPIDWDAKDMELSSGTIDCIWNGFTMNGKEDDYTWSQPYADNSQVFVTPTDKGIATQADLAGKTVGVQKDSSALAALEGDSAELAATFAQLVQYADYNTAFMDLEAGAIEALAIDIGVANYQIRSRGDGFMILKEYLSSEQYGVGFKKGNEALRDIVDATLQDMAADGTVDKLVANYGDFGLPDSICLGK